MTVFTVPGWLQNAGTVHTASQMRNYVGALIGGTHVSATALVARGGVHRDLGNHLSVSETGSPSMAVLVNSGAAWVPGTESASQGSYGVFNDASVTLTVTTAHATLPRIDIVQIRVRDSFYSGVNNDALTDIKAGTPNSSPVPPIADANALILAEILVGAGVTSIVNANITSKRKWLTATGGIIQASTTADLPTSGEVGAAGQLVYNSQTKELLINEPGGYQVVYNSNPAYVTVEAKDTAVVNGTTTSTTYVNTLTTSGIRGVSFIVPPSGKVLIHGMAGALNATGAANFLSIEVREGGTIGSGTVFLASNENVASENRDTVNAARHKVMAYVTGLTIGSTYNACLTYRGATATTNTYQRRHIIVQPLAY